MSGFNLDDVNTLECDDDADELSVHLALQRAVNSHMWSLQGSYGRSMMEAIEAGRIMLGHTPCRDYYGNRIPSRTEVKEGTKGSRSFVVEHFGEEWAAAMEEA